MRERPILFSATMVRAILDGRKTMTRRHINALLGFGRVTEFGASDTPGYDWAFRDRRGRWNEISHARLLQACPYGKPGDQLWVRETWAEFVDVYTIYGRYFELVRDFIYRADGEDQKRHTAWRPSIHMPRTASRLTLEITGVRVERLQDITEADAIAEGILRDGEGWRGSPDLPWFASPIAAFRSLWESINGAGSWDANPWVWVVKFRRIEQSGVTQ